MFFFSQMGKSEPTPQRFRRKAKPQASSSASSEQMSNSPASPPSAVDSLLCNSLLDSNISSEETSELSEGLITANGTCDVKAELTGCDVNGRNPSLTKDQGLSASAVAPHEDPNRHCLSSHLPAELSGFSCSDITPLCSSESLNLSACHVQKQDSLVLVVFLTNSSDSALQQILLDLDSEQLEVMYPLKVTNDHPY